MQLTDRFSRALTLTHELHQTQTRKDGKVPYISHLMGVSALVLRYGGNEDEAIAALLHDAAEDQGGKKALVLIQEEFGEIVAHIVKGCSDTLQMPKPPWKQRKLEYIAHLKNTDESTLIVAASDKLYNALDSIRTHAIIKENMWNLFKVTEEETRWYYRCLAEIFVQRRTEFPRLTSLVDETVRTIEQLLVLP